MTAALKLVPDDLQTRAAEARSQIDTLEQAARAADVAAAEAAAAFKRNPKAAGAHSARDISLQEAENAREALAEFTQSVAQLLGDAQQELYTEELAQLNEAILPRMFDRHRARVDDLLATFRRDLRGELGAFSEAVRESNVTRAKARRLAESLGKSDDTGLYQPVTLISLVNEIVPQVTHYSEMDSMVSLSIIALHGDDSLKVRVHISDPIPGGAK